MSWFLQTLAGQKKNLHASIPIIKIYRKEVIKWNQPYEQQKSIC